MSRINEKLGLKPAGTRSMMKLPRNRLERNAITAAVCPACGARKARQSKRQAGALWCEVCNHCWQPAGGSVSS